MRRRYGRCIISTGPSFLSQLSRPNLCCLCFFLQQVSHRVLPSGDLIPRQTFTFDSFILSKSIQLPSTNSTPSSSLSISQNLHFPNPPPKLGFRSFTSSSDPHLLNLKPLALFSRLIPRQLGSQHPKSFLAQNPRITPHLGTGKPSGRGRA